MASIAVGWMLAASFAIVAGHNWLRGREAPLSERRVYYAATVFFAVAAFVVGALQLGGHL